ncbi:MAG: T9SS type A sorting domain-containing protein [Bacteroidota bacterium]
MACYQLIILLLQQLFRCLVVIFLLCGPSYNNSLLAQVYQLDTITELPETVRETSGLLFRNGVLITHNDSGGEPVLYALDTLTGDVTREVRITNASNVDWEDLAADANYLYIGDFGNNVGNRTDLRIYRVPWSLYETQDTVLADTIAFAYAEQTDFSDQYLQHRFDAEALIVVNDSLHLHTKNWIADTSYRYQLPITPGSYTVTADLSWQVPGLITASSWSANEAALLQTGYNILGQAFVLDEVDGVRNVWLPPLQGSQKVEAIAWSSPSSAFLTTEATGTLPARLYRLTIDRTVGTVEGLTELSWRVYPQPASTWLRVEATEPMVDYTLYDATGRQVLRTRTNPVDISVLSSGHYVLLVRTKTGQQLQRQVAIFRP